jgi:phospholipase D1/2
LGLIPDAPPDEVTDAMLPLPTPQVDTTDSEEDRQVMDPLDEDTLALWNSTAKTNTVAFRHIFHCVPDDTGMDKVRNAEPKLLKK